MQIERLADLPGIFSKKEMNGLCPSVLGLERNDLS